MCMFAILFINTSCVVLLVGANLKQNIPILGGIFNGEYLDFTGTWFIVIGSQTVLNSIGDIVGPPLTYYFTELSLQISYCLDQKKCRHKKRYPCSNETKCRTVSEYWNTYSGPVYMIESSQSTMLNFVMTCFLFGPGVPVLLPIVFVCLCIMYVYEKKTICK